MNYELTCLVTFSNLRVMKETSQTEPNYHYIGEEFVSFDSTENRKGHVYQFRYLKSPRKQEKIKDNRLNITAPCNCLTD